MTAKLNLFLTMGLISLVCVGCPSDPKAPDDSLLLRMHGGTYDSNSHILGVPLGSRRQTRYLEGVVKCNPGLDQVPINHAQVDFLVDGKVMETTYTDREGRYSLAADIVVGRKYKLKVFNSKWTKIIDIVKPVRGLATNPPNEFFLDCSGKDSASE